jgi:hypothetical protein
MLHRNAGHLKASVRPGLARGEWAPRRPGALGDEGARACPAEGANAGSGPGAARGRYAATLSCSMSRSLVSGMKMSPMTTVMRAIAIGYQSP